VFDNRVLRRIFGPRIDEVTGEWRRLHNEELNYIYPSPNIVRVIKSRRMRWAGHVSCVCVGFVMCGCSGNTCTCIYCLLLFRLCIFILIYSDCTVVRTTNTEWQINFS